MLGNKKLSTISSEIVYAFYRDTNWDTMVLVNTCLPLKSATKLFKCAVKRDWIMWGEYFLYINFVEKLSTTGYECMSNEAICKSVFFLCVLVVLSHFLYGNYLREIGAWRHKYIRRDILRKCYRCIEFCIIELLIYYFSAYLITLPNL